MEITFWKDNRLDGKHTVNVTQIIEQYLKTEDSKLDMPFERKILNFMSATYGSFETITDAEWDALHTANRMQIK